MPLLVTIKRKQGEKRSYMANGQPAASVGESLARESLARVVADARATAADQLAAAWQLQIERIQDELSSGWREHLERVFDERFAELSANLETEFQWQLDTRLERAKSEIEAGAQARFAGSLLISARRLRQHEDLAGWLSALLEAASNHAERVLLFSVNGNDVHFERASGVEISGDLADIPLSAAPAFAAAVESQDTVVAMRSQAEISEVLAALLGDSPGHRFHLFPVISRGHVAAVMYADSSTGPVESTALELLAVLAGLSLESRAIKAPVSPNLVTIGNGEPPRSGWASLGKSEQDLHLRAQRFARVRVAEMRLYHSQAVKEGRTNRDLYASLKEEIDSGRDLFRRDYLSASPMMVDYLHLEVLRTLANDETELLGAGYPGPMV
ncbi:MAG TPA: hypothetical protein VN610_10505 [Bryobacteraceae bacterium]|nr:hypothetical protein [Bryobacteraceae bacterium]